MHCSVEDAETRLDELVEAALAGEEVVVTRNGVPVVRLTPVRAPFCLGLLAGKVGTVPDFLEPMPEDELRLWEGGEPPPAR